MSLTITTLYTSTLCSNFCCVKFFNDKHFPIYRSYKLFALHLNSLIVFVSSGTVVSLEVMNELLALLAHEGRGNREASEHDQSQKVINWPPPGQATPKRGTRKENEAEIEALKELESFQDEMRSSKQSCEYSMCYSILSF